MFYLDTAKGANLFREASRYTNYVDKSGLIDAVWQYSQKEGKYLAITKPRRFGKTMAANMLSAFFTDGQDGEALFAGMEIAGIPDTWALRNRFHVIHIDLIAELDDVASYKDFIDGLRKRLVWDLRAAFPEVTVSAEDNLPSLFEKTETQFIFIIDEWDAVFEMDFMTEKDRKSYVLFLRSLFKNKDYVKIALMTGVLPIAKYSSGSPLNMFHEFNAFGRIGFEQYYGFTEEEIRRIMERRCSSAPALEEIRLWYDGYVRRSDGKHIFNPDSVSKALTDGFCQNNWAGTGPMNDIAILIAENAFAVRDDILRMTAGEKIEVKLDGFSIEDSVLTSREDILSAMVVYGFLSYHEGKIFIPNLELAQKFTHVLRRGTLGVHMTIEESRKLIESTLQGRGREVAAHIECIHDAQIPFIAYSDENSLACVIMYAYYAAADWYDVRREEISGKGFVDFLFTPVDRNHMPIIMELKYNRSAKAAIAQIREKHYIQRMKNYPKVLLVGINYSERTKKHTCLIEETSYQRELEAGKKEGVG